MSPAYPDPLAPTPLEQELTAERAGTLGRAYDALERTLAELDAARLALSAAPSAALRAHHDELFAEAAERLWCLVVQREALGLFHHRDLFDLLHVSAELQHAMGPRRYAVPRSGRNGVLK